MIALLGPEPEIVLKLGNLYFGFFFLKFSNFSCADNSVIFVFLKFFLSQNKNFVRAHIVNLCFIFD